MDWNLLKTLKEQESQSCEETDGESHKKKIHPQINSKDM